MDQKHGCEEQTGRCLRGGDWIKKVKGLTEDVHNSVVKAKEGGGGGGGKWAM